MDKIIWKFRIIMKEGIAWRGWSEVEIYRFGRRFSGPDLQNWKIVTEFLEFLLRFPVISHGPIVKVLKIDCATILRLIYEE